MSDESGDSTDRLLSVKQQLLVPLRWLLALAALALVVSDNPVGWLLKLKLHSSATRLTIRLCLLLAVFLLSWWAYRVNHRLYRRLSSVRPSDESPLISTFLSGDNHIRRLRNVMQRYNFAALTFFTNTLLLPRSNIVRAVEEAVLRGHTLTLETSLTIDVTRTHPSIATREPEQHKADLASCPVLVVPIMRAKKGMLIDSLEVENSSGAHLPTLSQSETKDLMAYVVANLFWRAYKGEDDTSPFSPNDLVSDPFANGVLNALLSAVYDSGAMDPRELKVFEEILGKVKTKNPANSKLVDYLTANLGFLSRFYIIACEAARPDGTHLIVKYRKSLPLYAQTDSRLDHWRLRLGLRPYRFTIPIWLPFIVGSYHFKMVSPPGQYVMDHRLLGYTSEVATVLTQRKLREKREHEKAAAQRETEKAGEPAPEAGSRASAVSGPFLSVHNGRALLYAHLYAGGFRFREFFKIATVVKFGEIPPGALGGTAVIALVAAALITVFTLLGPPKQGASAPAILLATPTIAASVLGFAADNDSLLRSSLTARLGLIFAGLLSFGATLLYMTQSVGAFVKPTWRAGLLGGHVHFKANLWWLLLSFMSLGWAAHMCWILMARMHGYMNEVRASDTVDHASIEDNAKEEAKLGP